MADEVAIKAEDSALTPNVEQVAASDSGAEAAVRKEIDDLAHSFGYDPTNFSGFKDMETARAAVKLAVESNISRVAAPAVNLPADRFSKSAAQSEPTTQSVAAYQAIDYKALGLDDDDAAAKALRLQEKQLQANNARLEAMEAKLAKEQAFAAQREEHALRSQVNEIVSGYASPRYGTDAHRTRVQEMQVEKLIEMAGVIRQNSGHTLSLKACLNQARLLDEGTVNAANAVVPEKKPANSVLSQGGAPALGTGVQKMTMGEQWSQNPELRAKFGLEPVNQMK
jgi:hypothetical protein